MLPLGRGSAAANRQIDLPHPREVRCQDVPGMSTLVLGRVVSAVYHLAGCAGQTGLPSSWPSCAPRAGLVVSRSEKYHATAERSCGK